MNATTQTRDSNLFVIREDARAARRISGWTIAGISALAVAVFAMFVQPAVPQSSGAVSAAEEVSSVLP